MKSDPYLNNIPPQNMEAEESIISSIMLYKNAVEEIYDILVPEDFYRKSNQEIYRASLSLYNLGEPVDLVTLSNRLKEDGKLEEVGGATYLAQIVDAVPVAVNVRYYAKIVKDKSVRRSLLEKAHKITEKCFDTAGDVNSVIDFAEKSILNVSEQKFVSSKTESFADSMFPIISELEDKYNSEETIFGVRTGFNELDKITGGLQPTDLIVLAARPSMGKELSENSPVFMEDGTEKRIKNIKIGDRVASVDKNKSTVSGVFPQGIKPIYRVEFSDGRTVEAGLDHQWSVMHRDWEDYRTMTTKEIIHKLRKKRYRKRLYIPEHKGNFGKDKNILVDPYLLGVLIGDGSLTKMVKLTTSHTFILDKIKPLVQGCEIKSDYSINYRIVTKRGKENRLLLNLKSLNLIGKRSYEKFIPSQYISASKETRLRLLQGLIDTDGTLEKTGSMTYSTSSKQLKNDVIKLSRSLGAFVTHSSRIPTYKYKGEKKEGRRSYTIYINSSDYEDFVTIPFKKNRVIKNKRLRRSTFKSIEFIGYKRAYCISVDHHKELYLTNDYVVTHNTALALNIASNVANDEVKSLIVSLEMPKKQLINREIASRLGLNSMKFRNGQFREKEWSKIIEEAGKKRYENIFCEDGDPDIIEICSKARRLKKDEDLGLIIIDYLQLIKDPLADRKDLAVGIISRTLKMLAKELEIPVIALSQLNRTLENRADKRPILSDLRESGAIEQDADVVGFIYRDEVYYPNNEAGSADYDNKGKAELGIAKNRNGGIGKMMLGFDGYCTRFRNL